MVTARTHTAAVSPPEQLAELARQRPLTIDDLVRLGENETRHLEMVDGSLIVSPGPDYEHQRLVLTLAAALHAQEPPGQEVLPGCNVFGEPDTWVEPDVVVVAPDRLVRRGLGFEPDGVLFAVEVSSPSTRRLDLTVKRDLYREWKVPLLIIDRKYDPPRLVIEGEPPEWVSGVLAAL